MGDNVETDGKAVPSAPRRRPYRTPRLERLGTLTEITAAVGNNGKNDHAGPQAPFRKTS
jgi:hypothetical protein